MNSLSIYETQKRPIVRPSNPGDRPWAKRLLEERWGSIHIVARGQLYDLLSVPAMVAMFDGTPCGLATYHIVEANCHLTSLDACERGIGIGTALLDAVIQAARQRGCDRLWLITTNDNLDALRFYQRRGFRLAAVHPDALSQSRQLKPGIPLVGNYGIPLRDEIELEMRLEPLS
jgi:ribosomal protein S18 acetylase RimI-like enzyme